MNRVGLAKATHMKSWAKTGKLINYRAGTSGRTEPGAPGNGVVRHVACGLCHPRAGHTRNHHNMTHQRKPSRDSAPAGMREQVRVAASQAWQRPVEPIYLGRASRVKVQYLVPTLRRDGTLRGHQRARRFFTQLPLVILDVIFIAILIPWLLI